MTWVRQWILGYDTKRKNIICQIIFDKLDFIKINTFCSVKDTVKRVKWYTTDIKKTYTNLISKKGLVVKVYIYI